MLAEALRAEVDANVARFADGRDENGHRLVVRNGYDPPRDVRTSSGSVPVTPTPHTEKQTRVLAVLRGIHASQPRISSQTRQPAKRHSPPHNRRSWCLNSYLTQRVSYPLSLVRRCCRDRNAWLRQGRAPPARISTLNWPRSSTPTSTRSTSSPTNCPDRPKLIAPA